MANDRPFFALYGHQLVPTAFEILSQYRMVNASEPGFTKKLYTQEAIENLGRTVNEWCKIAEDLAKALMEFQNQVSKLFATEESHEKEKRRMTLYYLDPELIPFRKHYTDAGADLKTSETFILLPGEIRKVGTGVKAEIDFGYYGQICERSGLAEKGLKILGGVIDSGYTGEIHVVLKNEGRDILRFQKGDRVCQLVCKKIDSGLWIKEGEPIAKTERGSRGFGSSGI